MDIKQCIAKKGLQIEVDTFKRWQSVDIDFINSEGKEDEVQFDLMNVGNKKGISVLSNLFAVFCKENGFKTNTVQSVTVVKSADSFEGLEVN